MCLSCSAVSIVKCQKPMQLKTFEMANIYINTFVPFISNYARFVKNLKQTHLSFYLVHFKIRAKERCLVYYYQPEQHIACQIGASVLQHNMRERFEPEAPYLYRCCVGTLRSMLDYVHLLRRHEHARQPSATCDISRSVLAVLA